MTTLEELRAWCNTQKESYPEHEEEIEGFYQLAEDEVEEGESEANEVSHCIEAIEQLINEEDEDVYCGMCNGTGISASGPVDSSCSSCGGSGVYKAPNDDDFDPFDYIDR